ncbi:YdcF family protein [Actinokineospora sp. NPDC004072]
MSSAIPAEHRRAVDVLWAYHDLGHPLTTSDVGIGLGSHDLGVATCAAELWHKKAFPLILFTGANAPTTVERFPQGEAVHYCEHALTLGVPREAILVETQARNTGENIVNSRRLLAEHGLRPTSVTLISRPYQQRRAFATCRKLWPEVAVQCASQPLQLDDYVDQIGEPDLVINMLVGYTQRIAVYADRGFAIPQDMPSEVADAYGHLVAAGYTRHLVRDA